MLETINEKAIIEALKNRYLNDHIYTNIGPVLIAINPFRLINGLYSPELMRNYRGKKYFEMPPHVYQLADDTYFSMLSQAENQCVIISGESGSGKTETSKLIMQYISAVSGKSREVQRVKERMLSSNPVLEAFGNAKTVNNNNSSRFGKYMKILFDAGGDPVGGVVVSYLLEKSRVATPTPGERNFHAFYVLCAGASAAEKKALGIQDQTSFNYLNQTGTYSVDGIDDVEWYREMVEALEVLGFTEQQQYEIKRVLAGILHLGNITFRQGNSEDAKLSSRSALEKASSILETDAKLLEAGLLTRRISTGTGRGRETFKKPNNQKGAEFCRDTLAKALYSKTFDWIVAMVNQSIDVKKHDLHIGVLDIYGFEIFQNNGFEQICINFVNEKLQQIFIELTLKAEQDEYKAEGIPWKEIKYVNNKPICDFIEKKPGLLATCDDCCATNKTDDQFMASLTDQFGDSKYLECRNGQCFTIKHFAGDVTYQKDGFLEKNTDTLFEDLVVAMQSSSALFVQDMGWAAMEVKQNETKKRPVTVGSSFRKQVGGLMKSLRSCKPHYIRCIKPNAVKKPKIYEMKTCTRQVKYLGLLENVRVRRAGYAYRCDFPRFVNRYKVLSREAWLGQVAGNSETIVRHLCTTMGWTESNEYVMGRTKIFVQEATSLFQLEEVLDKKLDEACVVVQKSYDIYDRRQYYIETRHLGWEIATNANKERRRPSMDRVYRGDYLNVGANRLIKGLLVNDEGDTEKLLFSDRCKIAKLKDMRGFFARTFGGAETNLYENRFLMLSDAAVYSFDLFIDEKDDSAKLRLHFRVPLANLQRISLSTLADNNMIFHFTAGAAKDCMLWNRRKTEFLAALTWITRKNGSPVTINFVSTDQVCTNLKKQTMCTITWVPDTVGRVAQGKDSLIKKKTNIFEVHVANGLAASSVAEPPANGVEHGEAKASRSTGGASRSTGGASRSTGGTSTKKSTGGTSRSTGGSARSAGTQSAVRSVGAAKTSSRSAASTPTWVLIAQYDYKGDDDSQLSFHEGDEIEMVEDEEDGWYEGKLKGKSGYVPANYVEKKKKVVGPAKPKRKAPPPARKAPAKRPPCPWEKHLDEGSGDYYYYNKNTEESSWEVPVDYYE
jgi:myosin-1